jgi:hypothetical protein
LLVAALVAILLSIGTSSFNNWTPNIATEALSIAMTIVVVERIVRRETQRRVQPRLDRALHVLTHAFLQFARQTYWDYASTHLKSDLQDIPSDAIAVLVFWRERFGGIDSPRPTRDGRSLFLDQALDFVKRAQQIADYDRDLLPADLVNAIDNLSVSFGGLGDSVFDLAAEASRTGSRGLDDWLLLVVVSSAEHFGEVLRPSLDPRALELWRSGQVA